MLRSRKDIRDYSKSHERLLIKQAALRTITVALRRNRQITRKCNAVFKNVEIVQQELFEDSEHATYKSNKDINFYPKSITRHAFLYSDIQSDDDPENSEESCSEDITENDICGDIAWTVHNGVTHNSLQRLLQLLKKYNRYPQLPAKVNALLGNPRNGIVRSVEPGYYWYNGLKTCLNKLSEEISSDKTLKTLFLSINIDGVPLFKSSGSSLYLILGSIPCSQQVFLIGCYHGYKKPKDFNDFLKDFVDETINLITTGYTCQGKTYNIRIHKLICDAPAKAAVLNIMSYTGYYSCTKCTVKGASKLNRTYFTNTQAILRSEDFLMQTQVEHHKGISLLTLIPHFGPVSNVPMDYMHLVCLGVTRKLLLLWLFGRNHLKQAAIDTISDTLCKIAKPCIPKEFCRKPRSLEYIKFWKATEFRQFLLYTGPFVLVDILPEKQYINFCVLHVAIRILCSPQLLSHYCDYANQLLKFFFRDFETIYGDYLISYNVHNLIHLVADAEIFGVLDNFSAFQFKNYMQKLKQLIRKASQPLQQLCRRYQEIDYVRQVEVQKKIETKLKFPFIVTSLHEECSSEGFLEAIINGVTKEEIVQMVIVNY